MKITVYGSKGSIPFFSRSSLTFGGNTACVKVESEEDAPPLLIDCGSGVLSRLQEHIRLEQLEAVILTHLHSDHISDIGVLKYAMDLSRKAGLPIGKIPVYAPATPEPLAISLESLDNFTIIPIADDSHFELFGAQVHCFGTIHPFETLALRIEKNGRVFATTADTVLCANLQPLLRQANLALMDAGSTEKLRAPVMTHLTAAECGQLAASYGVEQLLLIHLLPYFDRAESLAEARQAAGQTSTKIELAEPGQKYEI